MKKKNFDKIAYDNLFIARKYDRINLTVPKGQKEVLQEHSKIKDKGSVNAFINRAISETMKRDEGKEEQGT